MGLASLMNWLYRNCWTLWWFLIFWDKKRLMRVVSKVILVVVVCGACIVALAVKNYADTHTPTVTRYCVQAVSLKETMPYWGDPITDELCVYANPVTSPYKDGTLIVNGSFGLSQFVVDLFPTKDKWTDTFGAWKYRALAVFITEDWGPFGPQWGIELVYNIGVPDRQIEQGWTLKVGNTTGGKGFETYIGEDGSCYIREIPDNRTISIFVPVK